MGLHRLKGEAYSAAKDLLCMSSRSTSEGLWTRKALWPEGIRCRVFLFEPYPILFTSVSYRVIRAQGQKPKLKLIALPLYDLLLSPFFESSCP